LLAMSDTSSHQRKIEGHPQDQRSLLATTNTSSHTNCQHEHVTEGHETDQRSLLAMTGTSFQAGWRTMRKAGRFLERFTRHGTVDWELKRPHYGGASG
jgi:hypothetical protein